MLLPHTDEGALVSGAFWAHKNDGRRWVFSDPRGINAPFGRRYEVNADQGTLALYPPWLSLYVEPGGPVEAGHEMPEDAVLWRFLLWAPVPPQDWSWVDDPTSSVIRREAIHFATQLAAEAQVETAHRH